MNHLLNWQISPYYFVVFLRRSSSERISLGTVIQVVWLACWKAMGFHPRVFRGSLTAVRPASPFKPTYTLEIKLLQTTMQFYMRNTSCENYHWWRGLVTFPWPERGPTAERSAWYLKNLLCCCWKTNWTNCFSFFIATSEISKHGEFGLSSASAV